MYGGTISGNIGGGGVAVGSAAFIMYGGTISGNTGTSSHSPSGAGVWVSTGSFTMYGGTIDGNVAEEGGGVSINQGTFTMYGGTISDNTAAYYGGGVYVFDYADSEFIMSGGTIYGNAGSTPTPPAGKANTALVGASLYKDTAGGAYWGNGTHGAIGGAAQPEGDGATTYIVGNASTLGNLDATLTASTP
jgi:hypothetical protein